jgi:hypothetical protein
MKMSTNEIQYAVLNAAKFRQQLARECLEKAEATRAANSKVCTDAKNALDELQAAYEAAENEQAVSGPVAGGKYPELERLLSELSAARTHYGIAAKARLLSAAAHEQAQREVRAAVAAVFAEADALVRIEQAAKLVEFKRVVDEQLAPLAAWLPVRDDVHTPPGERVQGLAGRVLASFHHAGGMDAPLNQYGVGTYRSPMMARRAELIGDPNAIVRDDQDNLTAEVERAKAVVQQGLHERAKGEAAPTTVREPGSASVFFPTRRPHPNQAA